jgi:hypothetical protein
VSDSSDSLLGYRRDQVFCYSNIAAVGKACHCKWRSIQPAKFFKLVARTGVSVMSDLETRERSPNVAQRLRTRMADAKRLGFEVRCEVLDGQQPGWCCVGTKRMLFLDLSASTREQLSQLEEILLEAESPSSPC